VARSLGLTPEAIFARTSLCRFLFLSEITLLTLGSNFMPSYQAALVYGERTPLNMSQKVYIVCHEEVWSNTSNGTYSYVDSVSLYILTQGGRRNVPCFNKVSAVSSCSCPRRVAKNTHKLETPAISGPLKFPRRLYE
jgi:hypothetical protein